MEQNYEIYHHGVKGQKWGIRRFQNKDGSLTKLGKKRLNKDDKETAKKTKEEVKKQKEQETVEQRRAKLLKSSDAQELYKNRHLLTDAEIRERMNRISLEKELGAVAAKEKVTLNNKVKNIIDAAKGAADNIEAAYQITQMPFAKALMKSLKGEVEEESYDTNKMLENINNLSDDKLSKLASRMNQTKQIQEAVNAIKKAKNGDNKDDDLGGFKNLEDAWKNRDKLTPEQREKVTARIKNEYEARKKVDEYEKDHPPKKTENTDSPLNRKTYTISKDQVEKLKNMLNGNNSSDRVTKSEVERLRKAAKGTGIGSPEYKELLSAMNKYNRQRGK